MLLVRSVSFSDKPTFSIFNVSMYRGADKALHVSLFFDLTLPNNSQSENPEHNITLT